MGQNVARERHVMLYYIISAMLIIFYIAVLWKGLHPAVSEEYRMYYMEKKLLDWPGNGGLRYTLGAVLEFGAEVESPALIRGPGWSDREERGIWTMGDEAVLYLDFSEVMQSAGEDSLTMRIELAQWFTDWAEVAVNGQPIGVIMPQEGIYVYELQLPLDILGDEMSVITFRVGQSTHSNGVGIKLQRLQIYES